MSFETFMETRVEELDNLFDCPVCKVPMLDQDLTYEEITKIRTWTLAQLVAWTNLQTRSGIGISELLAKTSDGQGDHVGVNGFHGMYVGIEKDGYAHS